MRVDLQREFEDLARIFDGVNEESGREWEGVNEGSGREEMSQV